MKQQIMHHLVDIISTSALTVLVTFKLLISIFVDIIIHISRCIWSVWSSCWYFLDECLTCWVLLLFWLSITGGFLSWCWSSSLRLIKLPGSEWSSFMAEKTDDLACAFSNFSSIFSFSTWFWIIYFFSRNFASIINSAILHLYSISRCIYFDAIDIYRDPILTAKIHSRQKLRATYFKCYKWIRVSKQTRGCSFWLRWRNKSL